MAEVEKEVYIRELGDLELGFVHQEDGTFGLHIDGPNDCVLDLENAEQFILDLTNSLGEVKAEAAAKNAKSQVNADRRRRLIELEGEKEKFQKETPGVDWDPVKQNELNHLKELLSS